MWAKVEGASITEIIPRPKAMTVGDTQYPRNIFDLWGAAELKGIGIYPITMDNTNWKATDYYTNTGISYTWDSDNETVTGAYGTATAKDLADTTSTVNGKESTVLGLKSIHKSRIDAEAGGILSKHDWMSIREAEGGTAIPSNIKTWRAEWEEKPYKFFFPEKNRTTCLECFKNWSSWDDYEEKFSIITGSKRRY